MKCFSGRNGWNEKGRKVKRIVAGMLASTIVLAFGACKKKDPSNGSASPESNPGSQVDIQGTDDTGKTTYVPHPDGVILETDPYYADTEIELVFPIDETKELDHQYIADIRYYDDFLIVTGVTYYEIPKEKQDVLDNQDFSIDALKQKDEIRYEYMHPEYGIFDYSGNLVANLEMGVNEELNNIIQLKDGRLFAWGIYLNRNTDKRVGYFWFFDAKTGKRTDKVKLTGMVDGHNIFELSNGDVVLRSYDALYEVDLTGKSVHVVIMDEQPRSVCQIGDTIYVEMIRYTDTGETRTIYEADLQNNKLGDLKSELKVPLNVFYTADAAYDIGVNGLLKWDITTGEETQVLLWSDTDIPQGNIGDLFVKSDTEFYFLKSKEVKLGAGRYSNTHSLVKLEKAENNPYAGRKVLNLGAYNLRGVYERAVIEYNKRPESKARVLIFDHTGEIDSSSAYSKAAADIADHVLLDMKSGNGPDILMNFYDYGKFNSEHVLVDLNKYLDGADGIDRSLYFDNVLRAFEEEGKLFMLPLSVQFDAMITDKKTVGGATDFTIDSFSNQLANLPENVLPFFSRDMKDVDYLLKLVSQDFSHYVDYDRYEVHFDSEDFIKLMNLSRLCYKPLSESTYLSILDTLNSDNMYNYHSAEDAAMNAGLAGLSFFWCRSLFDYGRSADLCGGDPCVIGWPTSRGSGLGASACSTISISAFSKNPDEAWDFVRYMLQPDVQTKISDENSSFAVNICRECLEHAMELNIWDYEVEVKEFGRSIDSAPMNSNEAAKFVGFVERINNPVCMPDAIKEIILEEAPAFFDGSKTAEAVAANIQSRVATMVAEEK
ncbi:MAG: extracellular solute-binding protein [Clostridiales bacterium]|nr:extracellular solute-binding protein [Clostridiales bacterium]